MDRRTSHQIPRGREIIRSIPRPVSDFDRERPLVFVASFSEFYALHYRQIAAGLAVTLGNPDLGAEATDEAMARAYARWADVSQYANPSGWVYRVGLNWARSWIRRAGRRLPWHTPSTVDLPTTADPVLQEALRDLDPKYRSVVVCRYFFDWSTEQTANALGINSGTVKSRLFTALRQLRTELGPDVDQPTHTGEGSTR